MDRSLIGYLPPALREVLEFKAINGANEPEISLAWDALALVLANQFLSSADVNGVARWEQELGIYPKDTDTLEMRKVRLKSIWNLELPYTVPRLKNWLAILCGEDGYSIEMEQGTYILYVKVALTAKSNFDDVDTLLKRIVPAGIVVDLTLKYNSHEVLAKYTHRQLAALTHRKIRNEVLS